ncbi:Mitochondrial ribosome small subunit biogenesis protein [Vermiconidia calcicola]|uniref:Mitochondrial ribosome small subunit biogenesis protein n=1 Tax=Vermiconidia calcicola TaxID=1690605 RepID=A0ACC3N7C5_9PEZI|nr:Mitochondrial ribosome small subunit biogenesis protein [Vermiconidia calcicola]
MLKSLRTSTRFVSTGNRTQSARCDRLWTLGPVGHRRSLKRCNEGSRRLFTSLPVRRQDASVAVGTGSQLQKHGVTPSSSRAKNLPIVCPGCGAHSQTVDADVAGFYGSKRAERNVQKTSSKQQEDEIFKRALHSGALPGDGNMPASKVSTAQTADTPICERCHNLLYQSKGASIIHPSMQSIQQIIEESPHKQNHIYHVLDTADFPMSLIPNLISALHLPRLRTQNRRSKSMNYIRGRTAEVSFIITRSDLLAPKKEQVDSLLPYLREVLRESLGRSGRDLRLGNVRCVSAHRGWWTKHVKEDIWNRGGAGWVVGKVNVGKSALYEVVFPKGRNQEEVNVSSVWGTGKGTSREGFSALQGRVEERRIATQEAVAEQTAAFGESPGGLSESQETTRPALYDPHGFQESELEIQGQEDVDEDSYIDETSLLPPAQLETAYPRMPIVSSLPGTTASPIRIPFGNGKGELIDLPGIDRCSLDTHVKPEHRSELVMKSRITPEQYTVKPGQSILLGGMIRITPKNDDLIFLAYPFLPLKPHVTSSDKATAVQTGVHPDGEPYTGTVENIATDAARQNIKSAGSFKLEWDVTKLRAGPLTNRDAGKQKATNLPFIIYSADILIEGVGWVELTCQVRNRHKSFISEPVIDAFDENAVKREVPTVPEVEVWSPAGKFVGVRRPMNAWVLGGPKKAPKHARRGRPRYTIDFQRRKEGGAREGARGVAEVE